MQVDAPIIDGETLPEPGAPVEIEAYWPISRIAARDGISKQAVSKHVGRYVEGGELPVERDGQGRIVAVDVAMYDALRERYGHTSRSQAPVAPGELPFAGSADDRDTRRPTIDQAQLQKTLLDAAKRRIEVGELTRKLIRADRYADAVAACGEEIVLVIEGLPQMADGLARDLKLDDVHLCRLSLKRMAATMRGKIAEKLDRLTAEAPATDEALTEEHDEEM